MSQLILPWTALFLLPLSYYYEYYWQIIYCDYNEQK